MNSTSRPALLRPALLRPALLRPALLRLSRSLGLGLGLSVLLLSCAGGDKGAEGEGGTDTSLADLDGDGFPAGEDCNDADASTNPGGVEICDGVDNDCDNAVDEDVTTTWYADTDDDGFGDAEASLEACSGDEGLVTNDADCDDQDEQVYPGGFELCDDKDNDCDEEIDEGIGDLVYADADADGYGDPATATLACDLPPGTVTNGLDCDDSTALAAPGLLEVCDEIDNDCDDLVDEDVGLVWYEDRDGDDYGLSSATTEACAEPEGYTAEPGDCDDEDAAYHPGAPETDCSDPNDYNCDGSVGYADVDGDGWAACEECDDKDALIRPDATEVCDEQDNDCDTLTDDADPDLDLSSATTWYADTDGDGYGDIDSPVVSCEPGAAEVADNTDCDDLDATTSPGAPELCDGEDDDCDGLIDDDDPDVDTSTGAAWHRDADGDGYGDPGVVRWACAQPTGYVSDRTDCDDTSALVSPLDPEVCDGVDNDCDGLVDDADPSVDTSTGALYADDDDADGYGDPDDTTWACSAPAGTTTDQTDCDDADPDISPAGTEICDGVDDDCDELIDDADPSLDLTTALMSYADTDGDGFGDPGDALLSCDLPAGSLYDDSDCDDTDADVSPSATEICDTIDNDCDTLIDDADSSVDLGTGTTWYEDGDGDGYGDASLSTLACDAPASAVTTATDCDDGDADVHPGAAEVWDCLDQDCDGFELPVGDGRDGAYTASGAALSYTGTTLSASASAGATSLSVTSSSGWATGDLALVYAAYGASAGAWEVVTVDGVATGSLSLSASLANTYSASDTNWVVRVPQYSAVSVPSGQTLSAPDWAGASSVGGGLVTFVAQSLSVAGTIQSAGQGYRGGSRTYSATQTGEQGETYTGSQSRSTGANSTGGGGGYSPSLTHADGGGGGYLSAGSIGGTISGWGNTAGAGGGTAGSAALTTLFMGGGGGAGGLDADPGGGSYGGAGGDGGGVVLISAASLSLSGSITVSGASGESGYYTGGASPGGGGGGAGGSLWLGAATLSAATGSLLAGGGAGGTGSEAGGSTTTAGSGGVGAIRVLLPSTVSASPTAYSTCP
jgi:hypothetical protein